MSKELTRSKTLWILMRINIGRSKLTIRAAAMVSISLERSSKLLVIRIGKKTGTSIMFGVHLLIHPLGLSRILWLKEPPNVNFEGK